MEKIIIKYGRPAKSADERVISANLALTPALKEKISKHAEAQGSNFSKYVRDLLTKHAVELPSV
jgi:predicted DNA binding CopG/RHH family protein